jgi:hypothetical protein
MSMSPLQHGFAHDDCNRKQQWMNRLPNELPIDEGKQPAPSLIKTQANSSNTVGS